MSDKARKLAEEKDAETIALKLGCHAGLSYGEQRLLVADIKQALLQFAQERESELLELLSESHAHSEHSYKCNQTPLHCICHVAKIQMLLADKHSRKGEVR